MARIVLRPLQTFGHCCHQIINTIKAIKTARHALSTGPLCALCWYDAADFTVKNYFMTWLSALGASDNQSMVVLCHRGREIIELQTGYEGASKKNSQCRSRANLGFPWEGEGSEGQNVP